MNKLEKEQFLQLNVPLDFFNEIHSYFEDRAPSFSKEKSQKMVEIFLFSAICEVVEEKTFDFDKINSIEKMFSKNPLVRELKKEITALFLKNVPQKDEQTEKKDDFLLKMFGVHLKKREAIEILKKDKKKREAFLSEVEALREKYTNEFYLDFNLKVFADAFFPDEKKKEKRRGLNALLRDKIMKKTFFNVKGKESRHS
ncbi:MAG: hypothetical protein EOM53_05410 [Alphaproteobacteria bacterium]|nr:hypothetical protein [Alphaproteobacteria bacterium]